MANNPIDEAKAKAKGETPAAEKNATPKAKAEANDTESLLLSKLEVKKADVKSELSFEEKIDMLAESFLSPSVKGVFLENGTGNWYSKKAIAQRFFSENGFKWVPNPNYQV